MASNLKDQNLPDTEIGKSKGNVLISDSIPIISSSFFHKLQSKVYKLFSLIINTKKLFIPTIS